MWVGLLALAIWSIAPIAQAETPMPLAANLQQDAEIASQANVPIAILFTAKGVKSGEKLKDNALIPELMSGDLDGLVIFREIQVNTDETTIDFYGDPMPNREFKSLYNLTSLPVVIFVNAEGDEIAEPLLSGAYDYYGYYLRIQLNKALKALGNPKRIPE
jgi:thioredoxin-related protein